MTIGELEFEDMFYGHEDKTKLPYIGVTSIFFICFLVIMPIIIMNLLVGLAVDDIKAVQDNAVLSRLAMQVSLNLDVEKVLPDFLKRKLAVRVSIILSFWVFFLKRPNMLARATRGARCI